MIKNNPSDLEKAVIHTLAYYRALNTPLTLVQVARYLISHQPIFGFSLTQVDKALTYWQEKGIVEKQRGLYWLKIQNAENKPPLHPLLSKEGTRGEVRYPNWLKFIQREKIAQKKLNIVKNAVKIIRFIPGLRGLFVCGSVARKVCQRNSDIDFFILTQRKRVWTVRFFLTILSFLLGKKTKDSLFINLPLSPLLGKEGMVSCPPLTKGRYPARHGGGQRGLRKNKFCLNHYRSSSHLKLEDNLQDLYSAQEYAQMINVYSCAKIENKFFAANKSWMGRFVPNFNFLKPAFKTSDNSQQTTEFRALRSKVWRLKSKLGDYLEKTLRLIQQNKTKRSSQNFEGLDNRRIVTDNEVIIFHLNPRAPMAVGRYKSILNTYTS